MVSFVLQVNVLYLIFVGLFWFCLWVYMYMCIFGHTFYCCYRPLPFTLGFCSSVEFSFLFLFSLILIFNFLNLLIFLHLFLCLLFLLFFPLQLIFNAYKFLYLYLTLHIYSFFPFLSTYLLVLFSVLYSPVGTLL